MGEKAKQASMYVGIILTYCTLSILAIFYPLVAKNKDIPLWFIGLAFSLNPMFSLISSMILGKYMKNAGRKQIFIASFVLASISMILLSPMEYLDKTAIIILTICSRVIGGISYGFLEITIVMIFASDYSDNMQTMISRMEASIGIGLIIGPFLGLALYTINIFAIYLTCGLIILLFTPASWIMMGDLKPYIIKSSDINLTKLLFKPVISKQKIFSSLLMCFFSMFSIGAVLTLVEIHLSSYGLSSFYISLAFTLNETLYLVFALVAGHYITRIDERGLMILGLFLEGTAYFMFGPWTAIFPNKVYIVIISMPILTIGQALNYCNFYSVYSIPYMMKCAVNCYGYENDDILSDTLSSFAVTSFSLGETLGSFYAGAVSDALSIEACSNIAGLACYFSLIVFAFGTNSFTDFLKKFPCKKRENVAKIEPVTIVSKESKMFMNTDN